MTSSTWEVAWGLRKQRPQDLACESRRRGFMSAKIGRTRSCPEPELPTSLRSVTLGFCSFLAWYGAAEGTKCPRQWETRVQAGNRKGVRTLKP